MSQVTIENFARQSKIPVEKLLEQLKHAGVIGKQADDLLKEDEKSRLFEFLKKGENKGESRGKITLKRKTTGQIKQTDKMGVARTVHVETRKKRTFIKRSVHEAESAAALQAAEERREQAEQQALEEEARQREQVEAEAASREEEERRLREAEELRLAEQAREEQAKVDVEQARVEQQQVKETAPSVVAPAATPSKDDQEAAKKAKKGKPEPTTKRKELHARRGRDRTKRRPLRKSGRISSSSTDQHVFAKPTEPIKRDVIVPTTITVGDLAQAMSIKAGEVIKTLMAMGSIVTINQILDQDTAILLVEEMGHTAKAAVEEDPEAMLTAVQDADYEEQSRSPVVTVMGHVDHGKTSLLDYLRKAKVAAGEAGGITQHIGAYRVTLPQGEVCFMDTPGHAAFSAMRARGASATDLVILVVAADDGVRPQTIEAIRHAKDAQVPIIVAINKIDREQADVQKVKQELTNHSVVAEDWGGDVLMVEVSALTGQGVDTLLESLLLQAEIADLKARFTGPATGLVIEARLDRGRGPVASVLVQQGRLNIGDIVLAGRETGRVRVLLDEHGTSVASADPSTPVEIQGLTGVPVPGDDLLVVNDERKAREVALYRQSRFKEIKLAKQQKTKLESMFNRMQQGDIRVLNLVVKADVQGSVEALTEALENLSKDEVVIKIAHSMVGGINESDVNLAIAADAMIIGFNVRADAAARKLIESESIEVYYHSIIYDVTDRVTAVLSGMLSPTIKEEYVGLVEVREVFRAPKIGAIAGCYVVEGAVKRHLPVRVLRDNVVIFEGAIDSLRRFKADVQEVKNGFECGIGIKNYHDIKVGDQIEVFQLVETAAEL